MHRIFTFIPYLQSYNTLPFYLADLGKVRISGEILLG